MAIHYSNRANGACILAVGYIRMSSLKQEASPDQQRQEITALAGRYGYEIIAWYIDEGISGDEIEKRPNFCRMLDDARNGKFQVILCWDQDRFGRFDSLRAGYVIEPLRMAGIKLVTVTQGEIDWNDFAGRMIYAIQQEGKNQFLHSLSQNVMRGCINSARNGNFWGRSPYGYDRVLYDETGKQVHRVDGNDNFVKPKNWMSKLDISENQQEVETVGWIFETYANTDANLRSIALELNRRGIPTRNGIEWQAQSVKVILRNSAYIGRRVYGKYKRGKYNHVGNGTVGGDGPIVIENAHPPLIDKKTWRRVQEKMDRRSCRWGRTRSNNYVLSGLLICGNTGERMFGRRASVGNGLQYYSARMPKEGSNGSEDCFSIRKDYLEAFVIGRIAALLASPDLVKQLQQAVTRKLKSNRKSGDAAKALKSQIHALEKKIAKGAERLLVLDADDLKDASAILAQWRSQRQKLADQLGEHDGRTSSRNGQAASRIVKELANLKETFTSADPQKLRAALHTVIESITLFWGPGGPRKWQLKRGVIRLGENWLGVVTTPKKSTKTRPTPTGWCSALIAATSSTTTWTRLPPSPANWDGVRA